MINFYLKLLTETYTNVYVYSTFFYPKLICSGYKGVCQWTHGIDIFSKRFLLFPVHLGVHWCLATVNVAEQRISYYDSLKKRNPTCLQTIQNYLVQKSKDLIESCAHWELVYCDDIPEQLNSYDCGMFVCMYARCLVQTNPLSFSQKEMAAIRRHVVLELLLKKLLP